MRIQSKPVGKTFTFGEGEDQWTVGLAQLREGDFIELGELLAEFELRYDEVGLLEGIRKSRNPRRLDRRGVYRSMTSCDLKWEVPDGEDDPLDLNGKPVFRAKNGSVRYGMTEVDFNNAWDALPGEVADEIVKAYLQVNPTLNPANQGG